jgi:hypothetical protein
LYDEPRVGAPRTVSDEAVEAVIVKTLETLPQGETHWSTRTMAAKAQQAISVDEGRRRDSRQNAALRHSHPTGARRMIGLLLRITHPGD